MAGDYPKSQSEPMRIARPELVTDNGHADCDRRIRDLESRVRELERQVKLIRTRPETFL